MKRILSIIMVVCIVFSSVYVYQGEVYGASELDKAKSKKAELEKQLQASTAKLEEYKKAVNSSSNESERLAAQAKVEEAEREVLAAELLQLYTEGEAINAALIDAENEYLRKEAEFYENSRKMYIYSHQNSLQMVMDSESVSDFFKRVKLVLFIAEEDNNLVEELKEAKQEYEYKKQYQEESSALIAQMVADKDLSISNINLSKAELQTKVNNAKTILSGMEEKEASIKDDLKAVNAEIAKLEKAEKEKAQQALSDKGSSSSPYTGGSMLWPVPASSKISSGYGTRADPFTGKKVTHTGIDIPAAKGSAILAAADGTVIMSSVNGGFGKCVKINHGGGIITLYGHCNELLVSVGQKVKKGDLIARVGTTGRSTGNHLHFEVQKNGAHTNPMTYLKG